MYLLGQGAAASEADQGNRVDELDLGKARNLILCWGDIRGCGQACPGSRAPGSLGHVDRPRSEQDRCSSRTHPSSGTRSQILFSSGTPQAYLCCSRFQGMVPRDVGADSEGSLVARCVWADQSLHVIAHGTDAILPPQVFCSCSRTNSRRMP